MHLQLQALPLKSLSSSQRLFNRTDLQDYFLTFMNERRPTNFDKKVLVWAGRFKKEEDIPKYITSEVLDAARNTVRIKVCYIMIALTLLGCLAMVITGKEAAKRDHTLLRMNEQKKAKWRAEVEKDQEAAAVKPQ
uniref:Family with sequence similarity 162 member B n=1 Tax=Anas platyrhynchos platyrhynchos TaxID=8840 RepID=U3ISG8_ANAPP